MIVLEFTGEWKLIKIYEMVMNPSLSWARHFAKWIDLNDGNQYEIGQPAMYNFGKARSFHRKLEIAIKDHFNDLQGNFIDR
jgi:hypothetical protein